MQQHVALSCQQHIARAKPHRERGLTRKRLRPYLRLQQDQYRRPDAKRSHANSVAPLPVTRFGEVSFLFCVFSCVVQPFCEPAVF